MLFAWSHPPVALPPKPLGPLPAPRSIFPIYSKPKSERTSPPQKSNSKLPTSSFIPFAFRGSHGSSPPSFSLRLVEKKILPFSPSARLWLGSVFFFSSRASLSAFGFQAAPLSLTCTKVFYGSRLGQASSLLSSRSVIAPRSISWPPPPSSFSPSSHPIFSPPFSIPPSIPLSPYSAVTSGSPPTFSPSL